MTFELRGPKKALDQPWVQGHILKMESGVTAVPVEYRGDGWWMAVIVDSGNPAYPVGGGHIHVSPDQIAGSTRIDLSTLT